MRQSYELQQGLLRQCLGSAFQRGATRTGGRGAATHGNIRAGTRYGRQGVGRAVVRRRAGNKFCPPASAPAQIGQEETPPQVRAAGLNAVRITFNRFSITVKTNITYVTGR